MPVLCKICNREFLKLISSTHLKQHGIQTSEYKQIYGDKSLASPEYRLSKSTALSGNKNPNYGNKMSAESKASISTKNTGKLAWNKGCVLDDTTVYKIAATRRECRYESGELNRFIPVHTQTTKTKIAIGVSEYAAQHTDEIKSRAATAHTTKISNGYYTKKRQATLAQFTTKCNEAGFEVITLTDQIVTVGCNVCGTHHTRSVHSAVHMRMCPLCSNVGVSSYEKELLDELNKIIDTEILVSDRTVLGNLELDIFIPEHKIAIEIDGLYWHSEEAGKGRFYHSYKTSECSKKGIHLIHIFEDEWVHKRHICIERLKSKLGVSKTSYARKYTISQISNADAYTFLTQYHVQGRGAAAAYCYGLYNGLHLCAVMTFSKLSIAKGATHIDGVFELNRYASIDTIVGGASRLFLHFIKTLSPDRVITYADLRWNTGALYTKLGFRHTGATLPNYWYTKGIERIHRFKLRKTFDDPIGISEKELRSAEGYKRIWDCGSSKWVWENSDKR